VRTLTGKGVRVEFVKESLTSQDPLGSDLVQVRPGHRDQVVDEPLLSRGGRVALVAALRKA
jgi:hypothetical protein